MKKDLDIKLIGNDLHINQIAFVRATIISRGIDPLCMGEANEASIRFLNRNVVRDPGVTNR